MAGEPSKPHSWWQTLPGILTAVATVITAITGLIVALIQAGFFSPRPNSVPATPTPTATFSARPSPRPNTSVDELEQRLNAVNIMLSTGGAEDRERVRKYFTGPESPYHLLAVSCLQVMDGQRLKKTGYLDMIDKHFSALVGENNYDAVDGKLNLEKIKEAMVEAQKDYHSDNASSFAQIVEAR